VNQTGLPSDRGLVIYLLRSLRGWTQEDLAEAMGTSADVISEYESGERRISQRALHRANEAVGSTLEGLYVFLSALAGLRSVIGSFHPLHREPLEAAVQGIILGSETLTATILDVVLAAALDRKDLPAGQLPSPESAHVLWSQLEPLRTEERWLLVETVKSYQTWDLCDLICTESREAAETGEDSAVELAELALHVAEQVPGKEDWRAFIQGFAWAHVGYARRERGDSAGAREALKKFRPLWQKGISVRSLLLNAARVADLEGCVAGRTASLH
jgi:transcriptional regulator with XRE-family HTH domain